jgi:hypothetical protein
METFQYRELTAAKPNGSEVMADAVDVSDCLAMKSL